VKNLEPTAEMVGMAVVLEMAVRQRQRMEMMDHMLYVLDAVVEL